MAIMLFCFALSRLLASPGTEPEPTLPNTVEQQEQIYSERHREGVDDIIYGPRGGAGDSGGDGKGSGSSFLPGTDGFTPRPNTQNTGQRRSKGLFSNPQPNPGPAKKPGGQKAPPVRPPAKVKKAPPGQNNSTGKKAKPEQKKSDNNSSSSQSDTGGFDPGMAGNSGSGNSPDYDNYDSPLESTDSKSSTEERSNRDFYSQTKDTKQQKKKKKTSDKILTKQDVANRWRELMDELKSKGYTEDNCPLERFEQMCQNPRSEETEFVETETFQAEGGIYLEAEGKFKNVRVNDDSNLDVDLKGESTKTGETVYLDSKKAANLRNQMDNYGNPVPENTRRTPDAKTRAYNSGVSAARQQQTWAKEANGKSIIEFYDLKKFRSEPKKASELADAFLQGYEDMGGDPANVLVIRYNNE